MILIELSIRVQHLLYIIAPYTTAVLAIIGPYSSAVLAIIGKKGKVFYGQEPPSGETTTTECGFNYQLLAVTY